MDLLDVEQLDVCPWALREESFSAAWTGYPDDRRSGNE